MLQSSLVDTAAMDIVKRVNMQVSTVKRLEGLLKDNKKEQTLQDIIITFICISTSHHINLGNIPDLFKPQQSK
jgi:hypothetical protein